MTTTCRASVRRCTRASALRASSSGASAAVRSARLARAANPKHDELTRWGIRALEGREHGEPGAPAAAPLAWRPCRGLPNISAANLDTSVESTVPGRSLCVAGATRPPKGHDQSARGVGHAGTLRVLCKEEARDTAERRPGRSPCFFCAPLSPGLKRSAQNAPTMTAGVPEDMAEPFKPALLPTTPTTRARRHMSEDTTGTTSTALLAQDGVVPPEALSCVPLGSGTRHSSRVHDVGVQTPPRDRRMRELGPLTIAKRRLDRRMRSWEALARGPIPKEPQRRPNPTPPRQVPSSLLMTRRRHGRRRSRRAARERGRGPQGSVVEREGERTVLRPGSTSSGQVRHRERHHRRAPARPTCTWW